MGKASCALVMVACLAASRGNAQGDDASVKSCLATLPESVFTRVTVFLEASATDSSAPSRRVLPSVDLLTQSVASRLRQLLGGGETQVPAADTAINWRQVGPPLFVAVYRDGRFSWRRDDKWKPETEVYDSGSNVLERALAAVRDSGERVYLQDESIPDSVVVFRLSYVLPIVARSGQIQPIRVRVGFPVFSVLTPWIEPVVQTRVRPPRYPNDSRYGGVEGTLLMQFVVDTAGRVDMRTLRDLWPNDRPRLTGERGAHYRKFLAAITSSLKDAQFEPAKVGGCPIRQLVQLPFAFRLNR